MQYMDSLSRTVLNPSSMSKTFPRFVATFLFCLWHNLPMDYYEPINDLTCFVASIITQANLPYSVLVVALGYIYRIKQLVTSTSPVGSERILFVCCLMLASKLLVDNIYTNKSWSRLTGIPLAVLNSTEMDIITKLGCDLNIPSAFYYKWCKHVNAKTRDFTLMTANRQRDIVRYPSPAKSPVQ